MIPRLREINWGIIGTLILSLLAWYLLFGAVTKAAAQALPPGAIAVTACLGGHIQTAVDAEIIGTDSLEEILVHEAKHREQARRTAPDCPKYSTPARLLTDEVEAYCASRPYRMVRGYSKEAVDSNYITRLRLQFKGALPPFTITSTYASDCP